MSEYGASETSSIFTSTGTFTSSSTVPGLGALSGKAIKRFGSAVVNGVDAILIRRRLAQIEDHFAQKTDGTVQSDALKSLYSDLLELSRPVYSLSIRTRAFRVIMGKVGGMDFENLAQAMIDWPLSESYDLLKAMITCLRTDLSKSNLDSVNNAHETGRAARLNAFFAAGHDAYTSRLPPGFFRNIPQSSFVIPFLLYIAFSVASSSTSSFSRLAIEVDLLSFITDLYPDILSSTIDRRMYSFPAQLVLHALSEKLDPAVDSLSLARLHSIFDKRFHLSIDTLSSIRSTISRHNSQSMFYQKPNILLLGPGETGKTTLLKQILKAFSDSPEQFYTDRERAQYIIPIFHNTVSALERLDTTTDVWNALETTLKNLRNVIYDDDLDTHAINSISQSRALAISSRLISSYSESPLEHVDYFLDALPRILAKDYLPSNQDIVQCNIRTTGIHSNSINLRGSAVSVVDFGGQFSERRKWINWFPKAGMIIYVASLSDYDETCAEDSSTNRMYDSMKLFDFVMHSEWFTDVPIVLLLNKTDVFAQKLRKTPLKQYFHDYTGGDNYDAGSTYIINSFLSNARPDTRVYLTSAVDEERIMETMNDIYDKYLEPALPYLTLGPSSEPNIPIQVQVQVSVSTSQH
ncbi:G-protein alpha subunit-domain-containing protein [Lentinula boryana]|uniref:G-protein alpha subunit-domain-containing protein n=1 Tax=Lentinula boryana TaxID=40481 RepID=A0ABQ8Q4V5_9AGAR|nr:G-protein alpha subunit-domain-containing protein [Lentinula boryana]